MEQRKDERRRLPRFKISLFIELSFDREEYFQAEALDLSSGGMKLRSLEPLEAGSRLYLQLSFLVADREELFKTEAVVMYAGRGGDGYELGLKFDAPQPEEKAKLERYLSVICCE